MTPASPPATATHWHRPGGVVLYEERPNAEGQYVFRCVHRCGCERVECATSEAVMLETRSLARESLCSTCSYRARRSATDEEQCRG
jgi:hypothetical protein